MVTVVCNITEAEGYRYSDYETFMKGITVYQIRPPVDTDEDHLAFGFMTWHGNGTLIRIESGISADHIHAKLVSMTLQSTKYIKYLRILNIGLCHI